MRGELDQQAYEAEVELVRSSLQSTEGAHWREYLSAWA